MAGQQIGLRQRPRFDDFNTFQNQNFQQPAQFRGPNGLDPQQGLDGVGGPQGTDKLLKKLEELLKKFMEAMQAQQQGGGPQQACGGGGGQKAGGAGGAQKAGGADPLYTLEELLKELRDLAQKNPEALQQFLQQNPQLAQMLGAQLGNMGGGALMGGGGMGGGMPAMDAGPML
jgi:hypothetical protein